MKSTYSLVGLFWDHAAPWDARPEPLRFDESFMPAAAPYGLFDIDGMKRYVLLSRMWAVDSEVQLASMLHELEACSDVALVLDYFPASCGSSHLAFYWHRVGQVLQAMSHALPGVRVVCMATSDSRHGGRHGET